jgi:hypothetical protein
MCSNWVAGQVCAAGLRSVPIGHAHLRRQIRLQNRTPASGIRGG